MVMMMMALFSWPEGTYQAGEQEGCAEVGEQANDLFVAGGIMCKEEVNPLKCRSFQLFVDEETAKL